AALTEAHVLTVSRGGETIDVATEIAGEYEVAMSRAGVVAVADYGRDGKPWFVRARSRELELGPRHAAALFSVTAEGPYAAWGYVDGRVIGLDTGTGMSWEFRGHADSGGFLAIDGNLLVTAGRGELRVWEMRQPPATLIGTTPSRNVSVQPSPDRRYVALDCM